MVENEPKSPSARAKVGDALSWIAMNLFLFAGLWLVFMLAIGWLAWILFGPRGDPQRTLGRHVDEVVFAFLLVGAVLFLDSIPYVGLRSSHSPRVSRVNVHDIVHGSSRIRPWIAALGRRNRGSRSVIADLKYDLAALATHHDALERPARLA
jgi:hypothetical protein